MANVFEGFPKELPDFLWGLAFNNEKIWFDAHRSEYERCLQTPFRALAFELADRMESRFPNAVPALHISRINRDARRLHGRGPYKDHLWFTLAKTSGLHDVQPCLYFEIRATDYAYGLGFWMGGGGASERWRAHIDANPRCLERLVRAFNRQDTFALESQCYKRPKGDKGKLLNEWYNSRAIACERKVFFEPDPPGIELLDELERGFALLMPLYKYMAEIT